MRFSAVHTPYPSADTAIMKVYNRLEETAEKSEEPSGMEAGGSRQIC